MAMSWRCGDGSGGAAQGGWRAAVDALRPHSQSAVAGASASDEQRRFLRHARPWWDVHRHRIAPEGRRRIKELVGEGRLEIVAGRVPRCASREDGLEVEIAIARRGQRRDAGAPFALVFNCTGPLGAMAPHQRSGARADARRRADRGRRARHRPRRRRADRGAGDRVWAMGPMTKGKFWEIIAVPDIRGQAAAVAATLRRS